MLHIAPALVRPLSEAGEGKARRFSIPALREGWAWAPRRWTQVSTDTGVGNPAAATPEKGERYAAVVIERLSRILIDRAAADPDHLYGEDNTRTIRPYSRSPTAYRLTSHSFCSQATGSELSQCLPAVRRTTLAPGRHSPDA